MKKIVAIAARFITRSVNLIGAPAVSSYNGVPGVEFRLPYNVIGYLGSGWQICWSGNGEELETYRGN